MSKAPAGQNGVALYFPYLTVSDKSWLLGSLCLWETVRRIVPDELHVDDADWLHSLVGEGMVKRADTRSALADARTRLMKSITPAGAKAIATGRKAQELLRSRFEGLAPRSEDVVEIYEAKGDRETWQLLINAKLAEAAGDSGYVRVARPVGELYMACLATSMAEQNGTPLITDQSRHIDWSRRVSSEPEAVSTAGEPMLAEVAALDLEWPDTGAFADCDPKKFCKFHASTAAARTTFRGFLLGMRAERAAAKSKEQEEDVVRRFQRELKAAHAEVLAKIDELGVKGRGGILSLVASVLKPWSIPDKLLSIGKNAAERRTAMSQMYKNPGYYTYLVKKNWL